MNMPNPLEMTARRAMVEELVRREPGISARKIAARLGVGKDTILRDLDAIETEQRQRATDGATTVPPSATAAPRDEPEGDTLVLEVDESLRRDLAVLRAAKPHADTAAANRMAVRAAIRIMADVIRGQIEAP